MRGVVLDALARWNFGAELAGALTLAALLAAGFIALGYVGENPASIISSGLRPYAAAGLLALAACLALAGCWGRGGLTALVALAVFADLGAALYQQRASWSAARQMAGNTALTVAVFNVYNRNREDPAQIAAGLAATGADILVL